MTFTEKSKMANKMNLWVKQARKKLKIEFGGACSNCGSKAGLQFAHIHPTALSGKGRGRKERILDIRKNRDSYRLLCSTCHSIYDTKEIL